MKQHRTERSGARHRAAGSASVAVAIVLATAAIAGPVWEEDFDGGGDAGSQAASGQVTTGSGALGAIKGRMQTSAAPGVPDAIDLFLIRVCDPEGFLASMVASDGGITEFGGRLYLFRAAPGPNALGLLGNRDAALRVPAPRLPGVSDDGSGAKIPDPDRYWLGVAREDQVALSAGGPIHDFGTPVEVSGPDGPGGGLPLSGWNPTTAPGGEYLVVLAGATFGGGPNLDCDCNGILDACDIAFGGAEDADGDGRIDACDCPTDFDRDGMTGFSDLVELLTAWGPGGSFPIDLDCDGTVGFPDLLQLAAAWGGC